jgi:hypothetical protein
MCKATEAQHYRNEKMTRDRQLPESPLWNLLDHLDVPPLPLPVLFSKLPDTEEGATVPRQASSSLELHFTCCCIRFQQKCRLGAGSTLQVCT